MTPHAARKTAKFACTGMKVKPQQCESQVTLVSKRDPISQLRLKVYKGLERPTIRAGIVYNDTSLVDQWTDFQRRDNEFWTAINHDYETSLARFKNKGHKEIVTEEELTPFYNEFLRRNFQRQQQHYLWTIHRQFILTIKCLIAIVASKLNRFKVSY